MNSASSVIISELLSPAAVCLSLRSKDRDAVLRELVELIPALAKAPEARDKLVAALHEREKLHSTGIGDGIALPHARNALVGLVDHAIIVFARSPHGIPFGAIDQQPARLFFLLIAPTVTQHLAILARISRLLRDPKLRQALLNAASPQAVLDALRQTEKAQS